jgi:hypothetical protein
MLFKGVKIALFSLALFFMAIHAVLPHDHARPDDHDHSALPNWVDLLVDVVLTDFGQDHLEDFRVQDSGAKVFAPAFVLTHSCLVPVRFFHEISPLKQGIDQARPCLSQTWLSATYFRGPPAA